MPDVVLQDYPLTPNNSNGGQLPAYKGSGFGAPSTDLDLLNLGLLQAGKMQQANAINSVINKPIETPLSQVLRYTDPNIGFNPIDKQLEYKYADAHPVATLRNNVLQFGARFLGAATETIATIPLAIGAAIDGDFSNLYDNDLTNGINEWLDTLSTSLPTYTTQYEEEHPVLKFLTPWKLTSFSGAVGGAINNLGFTAGAIAGALIEDVVITAVTGGAGLLPALAGNARQLFKGFTKAGKIAAGAPTEVGTLMRATYGVERSAVRGASMAENALETTGQLARAAEGSGGVALIRGEGTGMYQAAGRFEDMLQMKNARQAILDRANTYYKIRDAAKYNLALLTSATAEGAFEASDVYHRGKKELADQFFETYGRSPIGEEVNSIEQQAKEAGNFTMGANIALLYASNRINWGSLFKPTNQAFKEGITGWGKNIARSSVKPVVTEATEKSAAKIAFEVISKTPESRIGRMLLNAEKGVRLASRPLGESVEEASQFITSEGSIDYIKRKYNPNNLKQVGDFLKSFNAGVNKTFTTNEGWDNIVGGFVGGILGGGLTKAFKLSKSTNLKDQLDNQVQMLNSASFNGTLENRVQELALQGSLAEEHKNAVENGDIYKAKNVKFNMLYNWVASGVRANSYERRMEELDMARDLTGKSFESYWGLEDTEQNRASVNTFLDGVKTKAENIKANVEKVDYLTRNPHKIGTVDYKAYEQYKDALTLNLSQYTESQRRINSVKEDLKKIAPLLDISRAVEMTSVQSMSKTLKTINEVTAKLNQQLIQTEGNAELQKDLKAKKQALDNIYSRIQAIVYSGTATGAGRTEDVQFNGKDFVGAMRDLFNLYNGVDFENNKYIGDQKLIGDGKDITIEVNQNEINDDELADALEKLQDVYKLSQANYNIGKYYTYLRKGLGETAFTNKIKKLMEDAVKHLDENGEIKTPESVEEQIREEEYLGVDPGETTAEERVILKTAAKKTANKQPLSTEEQAAADKHEEVYTEYVKKEINIKEKVTTQFAEEADDIFNPKPNKQNANNVQPPTTANVQYKGATPENLFFALHRNPFFKDLLNNLHKLIFNTEVSKIGKDFTAELTQRPDGIRNITPVPNSNGIWRKDFDDVIQINNGKNVIGEVRPPESLFLDPQGTEPLFLKDGTLNIQEADFTATTGNDPATYEQFKQSAEAYFKTYNALKADVQAGRADAATIAKHFQISINTGSAIFNPKRYKNADTLLKNTKPKAKIVLTLKVINTDGKDTYVAEFLDGYGFDANIDSYNKAKENIQKLIAANPDHFKQWSNGEIMVAFPVGNQVDINSFVRGRLENENIKDYPTNLRLVTSPEVFENYTINFRPRITPAATNTGTITQPNAPQPAPIAPLEKSYKQQLKEVFTLFPALAEVFNNDTAQLAAYFKSIFPDSEVNGQLFYHGTPDATQDEYFRDGQKGEDVRTWNFFYDNKERANDVGDNVYVALLNMKQTITGKDINYKEQPTNLNDDSAVSVTQGSNEFIVRDRAQIHIIGNAADIEQAKQFVKDNTVSEPAPNNVTIGDPVEMQTETEDGLDISYTFTIQKNGVEVGKIVVETVGDNVQVVRADINPAKQGIGTEAYKQIAEWATKTDYTLNSNNKQSPAAIALWEGLVRQGLAFKTPNGYVYGTKAKPVVVEKQAPVTPAQKQSAAEYAKSKTALEKLIVKYFGVSVTQARATAELFDRMAQAWAARTGQEPKDYYKQIGYANKEEFDKLTDVTNVLNQIIGVEGAARLENASKVMANLEVAKTMQAAFKTRSEVRLATGWELMGDGKWRYEIPDNLKINTNKLRYIKNGETYTIDELLDGSEILKLYPNLANVKISINDESSSYYSRSRNEIRIGNSLFKIETIDDSNKQRLTEGSVANIKSTLIHELQHVIQTEEGFAKGGSPDNLGEVKDYYINEFKKLNGDNISKEYRKITSILRDIELAITREQKIEIYKRLAGEIEATNAQKRINYTDQQRLERTLSSTEEIDEESKIYLQGQVSGVQQSADAKNFFPNTKVVDKKGNPILVYHATPINFEEFDFTKVSGTNIGVHFGNKKTARSRALGDNPQGYGLEAFDIDETEDGKWRLLSGFLNITNPFRMEDSFGGDSQSVIEGLKKTNKLSAEDIKAIKKVNANNKDDKAVDAKVREILIKNGYDGIVYANTYEGLSTDSYIIFNNNQFVLDKKSAHKINSTDRRRPSKVTVFVMRNFAEEQQYEVWLHETSGARYKAISFNTEEEANNFIALEASKVFTLFQDARGAFDTLTNIIYGLTNPDITTLPHEFAHAWEQTLTAEERQIVLDWANTNNPNQLTNETNIDITQSFAGEQEYTVVDAKNKQLSDVFATMAEAEAFVKQYNSNQAWTRETSEKFAEGFVVFLAEGKTSDEIQDAKLLSLFDKFAKWLADAYESLKQALGIELNNPMREIYSAMLNSPFIAQGVKETINSAQGFEAQEEVEQAQPDYSISQQLDIDGNNQIIVIDKDGNFVENPNNEIDGYTFDTEAEAQAFINTIAKPIEQTDADVVVEKQVVEQPTAQYVRYKTTENGNVVEKVGIVIEAGDTLTEIQTPTGEIITKLNTVLTPATAQEFVPEITGVYKIGDKVEYGLGLETETYTITGVTQRNKQRITKRKVLNDDGSHKTDNFGDKLYKEEITELPEMAVFYTTQEGALISEEGIVGKARVVKVEKQLQTAQEQQTRVDTLTRIAKRFQKLFPDILIEIRDFTNENWNVEASARFYNGVVQINTGYNNRKYTRDEIAYYEQQDPFNVPWLKRETVAHEFMHPFVFALKASNNKLYNSLVKELQANHADIVDSVNKNPNYEEKDKLDEALTIYLGRELTKAFTKKGILDTEYVESRPMLKRFIEWLNDIVDFLIGNRKPKSLTQFIKDANADGAKSDKQLRELVNNLEELRPIYGKNDDKLERKVKRIKQQQAKVKELLNNDKLFDKLNKAIEADENPISDGQFTFIERINENHYVEFDESDPNSVKVYIDPIVGEENSLGSVLLQYADRIKDNDIIEAYKAHVTRNFYKNTATAGKSKNRGMRVASLNPLMRLQDVSDFLLNQLSNDSRVEIKYTKEELNGIDELEAYFSLNATTATNVRKIIVGKLSSLKDTANTRLNSDTLSLNYNIINRLNLDAADDADFVLQYIQQASVSINAAWRKYNEIIQDLKLKTGTLSKAELNRLNKELRVVMQLIGFYDEFRTYTQADFNFKDSADAEAFAKFQKSISFIDAIRNGIQDVAINSTIEWFTPYMESHNKYIKAEGYTDDRFLLTPKLLREHFKYGSGKDTNYITFWLGANVSSRNPVNATFANTMGDALSFNNIDTNYDATTINIGFKEFLTTTNISNQSNKEQIKYYKDNYLRQADVLERQYDKITGDYQDVYIKKWALHQEFLWDQYEKDLAVEKAKYVNPRNSAEQDKFDKLLEAWKIAQGYTNIKGVPSLTNPKYINKDYAKAKADKFFQNLEKHYNESNERYGENGLRYGIVPQQYDSSFLRASKELYDNVQTTETVKGKLTKVKQALRESFGAVTPDVDFDLNFDGTKNKRLSTNLTTIKNEENIDLNLHETMVNFVVESRSYSTLKETQYNAEVLMLLIEGNTKFGIPARTFAVPDISRKLTSQTQLENAKLKLAEMDKAIAVDATGIDMVYHKKLQDVIAKGLQKEYVWDKFRARILPASTNYNNEMLIKQINDVYFGEAVEQVNWGNVNANKMAHILSLYTSINSMAGNVIAGISNINTGNLQMFIEAHGGQYFNKKDLAKATADYAANIANYVQDLQRPIKSKDTQLSFLLDAVQGEIEDEFGRTVTGNIARKMFRINSLFFMTSLGEHQIQITGMKAMLNGRKVKTNAGETISLYDAFVEDANGRYGLRKDIDFTNEDLAKFTRDLHGVNRNLNGNYSSFNKTMLQRKWYGNLAMKFRKYLYSNFRNRWASEHVDYERNIPEVGYLRFFFGTYLIPNVLRIASSPLIPENYKAGVEGLKVKNLAKFQKVALRKATAEITAYASITLLAMAWFGGSDGDDKKTLTTAEKTLLLLMLRLRSDIGTFSVDLPSETIRQIKNPTASLNTIVALGNTLQQLWNPNEVYDKSTGTYEQGDSKLWVKFRKVLPFRQITSIFDGEFEKDVDNKLGYFSLINRNIQGVSPKQSPQ